MKRASVVYDPPRRRVDIVPRPSSREWFARPEVGAVIRPVLERHVNRPFVAHSRYGDLQPIPAGHTGPRILAAELTYALRTAFTDDDVLVLVDGDPDPDPPR
jgi:hypothetical protein